MNVAQKLVPAATRLVVRCLGRFRIEGAVGERLQLRTRKARGALACLALSRQPMPRDALAALLWSDRGPAQARSSVRQVVYELQHLKSAETPVLAVSRDELAVRPELVVTDLELIRSAAAEGDWPGLLMMLEAAEPGLLTDLDGLDPEFDGWLWAERAQEPARTLAAATAAAERCRVEDGPRAALELVTEILRLDPANEEAARLVLAIHHQLGDSAALHRHFQLLSERLREDFDAEPSAETVALFRRLSHADAPAPPAPAATPAADLRADAATAEAPAPERRRGPARPIVLLLILGLATALLALFARERWAASAQPVPVVVAVLPFEPRSGTDGLLAGGLWEHTRNSLTRNPSIRVLGRTTTAEMAARKRAPEEYRRRFGVTHLLEGAIRRSGDEVLISVTLARTSDGVAVWHEMLRATISEPFSFHDAVARMIEGKLRGRLADGGGRRADQIVTTPEVYALHGEARRLIGTRRPDNVRRAQALLRDALRLDENFAPAWSLFAAAIYFGDNGPIVDRSARKEATEAARRALSQAPNLAQAHAILALIHGGNSAASEQALRRAVALDPSYAEAWMWLGNSLGSQMRIREAAAAYERAVEIDPLFHPAVQNLAAAANEMNDSATIERLLQRITRAGADRAVITSIRAARLRSQGDYSGAYVLLSRQGLTADGQAPPVLKMDWFETLTGLGEFDALRRITGCPDWYPQLLQSKILPPKIFEGRKVAADDFWTSIFFSTPASRSLVNRGRSDELVRLYRRGFADADAFISGTGRHGMLLELAPTVAMALNSVGATKEASYLLAITENLGEAAVKRSGNRYAMAQLAAIRAARGERHRATAMLEDAVRQGWLPDGRQFALDLAHEPAFRSLSGDARFAAVRRRILAHIQRERAELGPARV